MAKKDTMQAQEVDKIKQEAELNETIKTQYKAVKKIVSEDGEHTLWLRTPSRLAVGSFLAEINNDVVKACEYIFYDAAIAEVSDLEYFNKDENFYGILKELQRLPSVKKSTSMTL